MTSRVRKTEIGYTGISAVNGRIYEELRLELTYPENIRTYKKMAMDPIIKAANNVLDVMISRVPWEFKTPKEASQEGKDAAAYLNWCMNHMAPGYTWRGTIEEIGSYRIYGHHVAEKVYDKVKTGKYAGRYKWKKLATRSQDTLDKWVFSDDGRDLLGVEQSLASSLNRPINIKANQHGVIDIPRNKFLHFKYGSRRENPEGDSPLKGAYISWKTKTIVEEYELVGVSKDLGGIPVIGVHVDMLRKAAEDPNSPDATIIADLEKNAANLHAGDKTFIITPLDYDEGKPMYSFDLIGVSGSGKQFDINEIIQRKQNEILWIYLADVLKLGTDSHGSFSLADSKNALLAFAIEHHLQLIADVFNEDLVRQTLAINGIFLEDEDMPYIEYGDIDDVDLDNFSKFVQRAASTGFLPRTEEVVNEVLDKSGFEYRIPEGLSEEAFGKLFPEANSKSGDGMKTAGDGTSNGGGNPSDRSVSNTENT